MRKLLTVALVALVATPAMAGNWYVVAKDSGTCKAFALTPREFRVGAEQNGYQVDDHSGDDKGVIEYMVHRGSQTLGMVFVNDRELCDAMADMIKTTGGAMPYQIREQLK